MMPSVQAHVVRSYGSVRAFEDAHIADELMLPITAIKRDTPNVWLTSFYGFAPEKWGFLGFADETRRQGFLRQTQPGVLVVIYGSGDAPKDELYNVIGIQQCSHQIGSAEQFMHPLAWDVKRVDPDQADRWNYAVRTTRAWRVTPESRMNVRKFAPEATRTGAWQHIGSRGVQLSKAEAENILKLDLQEVDVYGENPILGSSAGSATEILAPSKPGPVSQRSFVTRESEGPKHLYILRLKGDTDAFLGKLANGQIIVKAGFSKSPQTRCDDHNRTIPECAFRWEVLHSGPKYDMKAYPTSEHAKHGERVMQQILSSRPRGRSLGGEFFLAEPTLIQDAWEQGNQSAKEYTK